MKEIHAVAQRRHPGIEPWFCSWWWTPEEHTQFNDWAAKEAPGWLKGMTMHIEYGQTRPKDVTVPAGCRKLAFVHIGYGDQRDTEVYGRIGAVIAPQRIPETLRELRRRGFDGFQAYSEGVFDDCNKTLLAGLGSGQFPDADAALARLCPTLFRRIGRSRGRLGPVARASGAIAPRLRCLPRPTNSFDCRGRQAGVASGAMANQGRAGNARPRDRPAQTNGRRKTSRWPTSTSPPRSGSTARSIGWDLFATF